MIDDLIKLMVLESRHVAALDVAERLIFHFDFCPYFELRSLFKNDMPDARIRFRRLFTKFYDLNTAGLTTEFHDRFFEMLFDGEVIVNQRSNFAPILNELQAIKRCKGDLAMPFSFVSKLFAMHDETSPIYDRHVLGFFNRKPPPAAIEKAKRIEWFERFLRHVAESYTEWSIDPRVEPILCRFREHDKKLCDLHPVRLLDFLVWKVGNAGLLPKSTRTTRNSLNISAGVRSPL